jgi:hypothetical protein
MRSRIAYSMVFAASVLASACGGDASSATASPASASLARGLGRESLPFRGTITTADQGVVVPPNLLVNGTAEGTATHLGRYTAITEAVAPLGGNTATGSYVFTAANGDQFTATFSGSAEPAGGGGLRFTEVLTIVSGTGRFAGATGTFSMRKIVYVDAALGTSTGTGTMEGEIIFGR